MANTPHILLQIRVDAADPPGLSKLAVGARSRCALGPTAKTPRTKHDPLKIPPRVPTPVGPTSLPLYIRLITNASEKKLRKEREREESFVASSRECEANRERSRYQIPISQPESPPPRSSFQSVRLRIEFFVFFSLILPGIVELGIHQRARGEWIGWLKLRILRRKSRSLLCGGWPEKSPPVRHGDGGGGGAAGGSVHDLRLRVGGVHQPVRRAALRLHRPRPPPRGESLGQ